MWSHGAERVGKSWGGVWQATRALRGAAGKSRRHSETPGECMCHIHEMASGAAAETRHQALRVTEALLQAKATVTLPLFPWPPPSLSHAVTSSVWPDPWMSAGWSRVRRSHRRCNVMVRDCQNRCQFDCRVLHLLGKAERSIRCRTPETWQGFNIGLVF